MRTITIKYPNLEYTLPTISAQAGGFEGSDASLFLALVGGKPSFAVLADIEGEAHDMVLNFPTRIPVEGIERRFNDPQPAELHGVEFKELTNADIIALANLSIPEWDAHYSDSWEHTFTVLEVDPVIVAAMHANEGVWTEEVQTDWGEITASYTTVDGDGTEYMVLTPAEYSQYEDDQARDQLVDRIDEMEDGVLKSLIRRNESALIADFKNMPEFDPKYSTSIGVASHDFYVIELD
ncbi:hypothetical protein KF4_084 [Vibrio phage vB_VpaS_KF4]|nr:hypothetical protein KF3_050 [Vibrio phage vB_VpaS_KF3]ATI19297.1 hypothetical protein KF4_084 [Vibrio phage vB_VpaS_KF4]